MKKKLLLSLAVLGMLAASYGGYRYYTAANNTLTASCCDAEGTCSGDKSCTACKNCKYCKHCSKNGGSCGVCK